MFQLIRLPFLGALLALCTFAGTSRAKETQGLRYPSLTPDGKSVVFCYRGDIWIATTDGKGRPMRLTIHEEQDTLCRVSPDGKQIAFSSKRHGGYDLYVMPITGGEPKRVTFHSGVEILCDWSPDGKKLLFVSNREPGTGRLDLYEVDLDNGGTPRRITRDGAREGTYSKDGKYITYVRGFNSIYWDNYKGSANYDIYVVPAAGGIPKQVTDTDGNERYPCFSSDSKTIYFVAEEKGVANFYSMPAAGGQRTQLTKYKVNDVHRPDLNWDHKTTVFEIVGKLYWTDLEKPTPQPTPIKLTVQSDVRNSGLEVRTITSGGEQVHLSADASRLAFVLRGDIWVMSSSGGNARRVTDGPANDQWPRWSPDGKTIAYFSNQRGNNDLVLLDLASGRRRPLTNTRTNEFFHNWSPDGKTIVFCREAGTNKDIWTLNLESGQEKRLTKHPGSDDDPSFSTDGKLITFDSNRGGGQAIYIMNADGSGIRRVSQGAASYQVPSFSPDGHFLVFERFSPTTGGRGIYVARSTGGPAMQISSDGSTACWSPRGDFIYFTAQRGPGQSGIFRLPAPKSVIAGERVPFIGRVQVDRRKELSQLFDEAHTALKNGFYDAKHHKVNWAAMKKKYRAMAVEAENKDEFHNIMRQMLAELGASHLGISGGQRDTSAMPSRSQTGHLGLELEHAPLKDGSRRVVKVIANGPADQAGIRVGDVVTKLKGKKLKAKTNLDKVLDGTAGKAIPIEYKPQSAEGLGVEKTVSITPTGLGPLSALLYRNWVATCARRVKDASADIKGEVGYVHLSGMNPQNLIKFQQAVQRWNQNKKIKGMVLDVRNNGGGNIHQQLMAILIAKPLASVRVRGGPKAIQPGLYWDKPIVLLCNERSFSDAEVFPYMYQTAKVGKVVGVPTAGGVIGTRDITLSDGSRFRVPRVGFWGMDGTNLEGLGVKPDIIVEETVEDRLKGRDPQLSKALEVVIAEIKEAKKKADAAKKKQPPKPDPKPQPKPDVQPVAKGDQPKPAPTASARHPLADARVGEWVRYKVRLPGDANDSSVLVKVTRVTDDTVVFERVLEKGGAQLPLPDKLPRKPLLDSLGVYGKLLSHSVAPDADVAGKRAELLTANLEWPDGTRGELFFSNHIPAYGLWKVVIGRQTVMEAVEWGAPEATEEPATPEKPDSPAAKASPAAPPNGAPSKPEAAAKRPAHPLSDAKVGEWIKVRRVRRGVEFEVTQRVTDADAENVTIQVSVSQEGRAREFPPMTRAKPEELKPVGDVEATYAKETVTVNEKKLECIVMTFERNGVTQKLWICLKLPVDGLVRHEQDGEVIAEVLEWGVDDDS